ncbi:MAG TPA: DUF3472 domain-containing protein [Polyangiales bacterium]|nr:DUF3472 domain-containing protein [Polyangiales bacterium]
MQNISWLVAACACVACGMPVDERPAADGVGHVEQAIVVGPSQNGSPGYTTTYWNVSDDPNGEYDSIEQMVVPLGESPSNTFYLSTAFYYHGSFVHPQPPGLGPTGYMGLQTSTACSGRVRGSSTCPSWCARCPTPLGKQAIFSIWDATWASSTGIAREFGDEGTGYQTIISYEWKANRPYLFSVRRVSEPNPETGTVWTGFVTDVMTGQETEIGTINAPHTFGKLKRGIANFTEYYGPIARCSTFLDMRPITVAFAQPWANQGSISDPLNDTTAPVGFVQTDRADRPTCDGAASQRGSTTSPYGSSVSLHRMFGRN